MKKKLFFIMFTLIFFNLIGIVSAQSQISMDMEVNENGFVDIQGESSFDPEIKGINFSQGELSGSTQSITSNAGDKWMLDINLPSYEIIDIEINFPKETRSINNIDTNLSYSINPGEKIKVEILDSNKTVNFSSDYKLDKTSEYNFLGFILAFVILALILYIFFMKRKKTEKMDIIKPLLNENEEKIVNLLMKKPMRQKETRKKLNIPKSSFTRYIHNLEKKKIILREGEGKNKLIRLK